MIVGKKHARRTITEYYHRAVVAHLVGFDMPLVLDLEMIEPGEGEIVAARRLLERLVTRYGRFFDAIQGDALYFEAPLWELCRRHGKYLLAVLKENNPALLADAKALLQGEPDLETDDERRRIRYWDREEFATAAIPHSIRVLRTEETQHKRERIAGKWIESEQTSTWFWATSVPVSLMPARQLCPIGHERWKIENQIFNTLSQHWALDHCWRHDPDAILNFLLILFIAHILLFCFHARSIKPALRRRFSLIAIARELLLGLADPALRRPPWPPSRNTPPPR